ncbi:MAG: S1/P1 Nuclease [Bacteroidetes bacterium RIFCSPLOWO2_12_FULL_35_15]|nr:MAG: S1/P1 Nuclease [Bacteroidetes bacterium RIFCSPLOWO2_12_FULL_35_15]
MRKFILILFLALLLFFIPNNQPAYSWGFYAHQKINRMAVFTLPAEMIGFYKKHIEYISQHAVDPDKRRYANPDEAPRHYIDIDHYGSFPFDSVPKFWKSAIKKYSEDTLKAYGIVPWHIEKMVYRLTEAFKDENLDLILHYSADLGHYIADSHVPLHTTENYNGQMTNQKGIHGFWESRIPEMKSEGYDYWIGKAKYIDKPIDAAWNAVKTSHAAVDSVLRFEAELNAKYPQDKKYSFENRGATIMKVYSKEYTEDYDKLLNGMVERRMRAAIISIGSLWYTAWINAGKPNLNRFNDKDISDSLKLAQKAEEELWKNGNRSEIKGHND